MHARDASFNELANSQSLPFKQNVSNEKCTHVMFNCPHATT